MDRGVKKMVYKPDKKLIKGKKVKVGLETPKHRILGRVFLIKNERFSDLLNNGKSFVALTDVKVFSLNSNKILSEKDHFIINKDFIVIAWEEYKHAG